MPQKLIRWPSVLLVLASPLVAAQSYPTKPFFSTKEINHA